MRTYNVYDLIVPDVYSYSFDFKYRVDSEGRIVDTGGTEVTIFSNIEFFHEVKNKFGHMLYPAMSDGTTGARAEFKDIFDVWSNLNRYDFARMFEALRKNYNPLESYIRYDLGGETNEHHKGSKNTRDVAESGDEILEKHKGTKNITDDSVYGYNSTDASPSDKSVSTTTDVSENVFDKDKKTFSNRKTEVTEESRDISETVFDKDVQVFNDRVTKGNVGILSQAKLLDGEAELRMRKFKQLIIADFIKTYCFYAGGVE